jgi:hypothetical protein
VPSQENDCYLPQSRDPQPSHFILVHIFIKQFSKTHYNIIVYLYQLPNSFQP